MRSYPKILNVLTLCLFMGLILLPYANGNFHFIEEEEGSENRAKTEKPEYKGGNIDEYIRSYEDYYTDNFSLRNNLINFLNRFEFSLFKVSPVPDKVIVGKNGWFYEKNCAKNYKGANLFSGDQLETYKQELIKRTKWAARRGIKYYMVVVPDKMTIYPEYLPSQVIKVSDSTRYDQVVSLNNDSTINVLGLKNNLLKHKNGQYEIYQRTDDHWNELGAYYGYEAIIDRIGKNFPDMMPHKLSDYDISVEDRVGNMANMINVQKDYPEHYVKLTEKYKVCGRDGTKRGYAVPPNIADWDYEVVKVNDCGKKLKCLIIRDSFTFLMMRFLQENFKESVFIHGEWKCAMNEDLILKEKPDIVLNITVETYLGNLLNFPFALSDEVEEQVNLLAANGKYVCVESKDVVVANRPAAGAWETFTLIKLPNNECALLSYNNFFLSANLGNLGEITARTEKKSDWERFKMEDLKDNMVAFRAANGKYLSIDPATGRLFASSEAVNASEKFKLIRSH